MGVLKKPLAFITIVALVLLRSPMVALGTWSLLTWRVDIVNGLSNGEALFVHCKSKDDDLGEHKLKNGTKYGFSFQPNMWGTTLFWCFLRKPNHAHAAFDVYWFEVSPRHWFFTRCNWINCIWIAKVDGIYIKNIPLKQDEFVHPWE